jgi:hypothetical protein
MTSRPWIAAAACVGMLAAWTPGTGPGPKRYKIDLKTSQVVNLTALGQGEQTQEFNNVGFVTLSATDSAGGQAVTVVLDSLQPGEGSPIPAEIAKGAAGSIWHGFREATGRVKDLTMAGENPAAGILAGVLRQLFPPMKAGTREGAAWTDTTETTEQNGGLAVRTVTNFQTARGDYNGTNVLKLAGTSSSAVSGQQESPQGSMAIEGTGTASTTWYVSADGTSLGVTYTGNQNLSITGAFAPEPIPLTVTIQGTSTLLN